ncbi:MAG: hypothetical protein IJW32_03830 [Clostridia bacterium]|nr:hypothetical protein [Clostridia bacterium]
MELFFIIPGIISLIIFITIITVIVRVIKFGFKVGKNVSQTILDKTDPNKNKDDKKETLYEDNEMSVRLQQDQYDTKYKSYTICKYCGCKNRKNVFRCSSCNAPLNE